MNLKDLERANKIVDAINDFKQQEQIIIAKDFVKKVHGLDESVLIVGCTAMLAAIHEAIDNAQRKLDAI